MLSFPGPAEAGGARSVGEISASGLVFKVRGSEQTKPNQIKPNQAKSNKTNVTQSKAEAKQNQSKTKAKLKQNSSNAKQCKANPGRPYSDRFSP